MTNLKIIVLLYYVIVYKLFETIIYNKIKFEIYKQAADFEKEEIGVIRFSRLLRNIESGFKDKRKQR